MKSNSFNQSYVYQLNTRIFCIEHHCTIGHFPESFFTSQEFLAADYIWLMGIWMPSQESQKIAKAHLGLREHFKEVLPDYSVDDVIGSPYSIYDYQPNPLCAKDFEEIRLFKNKLRLYNKKLILDFVPNHMSVDTPFLDSHPECFLYKKEANPELCKNSFFRNGRYYYHGRDPYFDGWTDTVQWDFSNPEVLELHKNILERVAKVCDGVRCDMAMLPEEEIFEKTHGKRALPYWQPLTQDVKSKFEGFLFIAEVYWDMEYQLQTKGFDFTYDKVLYDRLKTGETTELRLHLNADLGYQEKSLRFIENHDEERAYKTFGDNSIYCFALLCFLPGMVLYHQGQSAGLETKLPVQLKRRKNDPTLPLIEIFYHRVFHTLVSRKGVLLHTVNATLEPYENENLSDVIVRILFPADSSNKKECSVEILVFNPYDREVVGRLNLHEDFFMAFLIPNKFYLKDICSGETYEKNKNNVLWEGIFIKLRPRQAHWFVVTDG